jgi:aldose 1-epimerase
VPTPLPPTGEQIRISAGDVHAVVTEVGAGLRAFAAGSLPYVETFDAGRLPPKGAGCVLVPWPNRVRGGRWTWNGAPQQLDLTEPKAGNAIHGLLRHTYYAVAERSDDAVTLAAKVAPQSGWPVPLDTSVRYRVSAEGLTVTHTLTNLGTAPVPVGVGAHPYLRAGDVATDDTTLTLAATTALPLADNLPTGPDRPVEEVEDFRGGRPLRGLELDHAFGGCVPVGDDSLVRHRLTGPDGAGVELWAQPVFRWVQVFVFSEYPGRGRAVAVEPMTCPPDALNSGTDLVTLGPGATFTASWGLRPLSS